MIDEQDRHVHLINGPSSIAFKAAGPEQLPQGSVEQQAAFGDVLLHQGFLPVDGNGVEAGNGVGNGPKWNEGESRNILSAMSMSHPFNQHLLTDPSIQETLSPFFQPFGVDVSHLPMTNPPIFQSSLTRFDEPVRRRRISISNGQISQLGEDLETVENLYNTQPPPLPQRFDQQGVRQPFYETATAATNSGKNGFIHSQDDTGLEQKPINAAGKVPSWTTQAVKEEKTGRDVSQDGGNNRNGTANPGTTSLPYPTNGIMSRTPSSSSSTSASNYGPQNGYSSKQYRSHEPIPGTNAWKRARLLERNRIAASKCRQRKKVAQLQLQKDYDVLTKENRIIKKKLEYYEKLVSKFKKFSEVHFKRCSGSDNQSFGIIEEMLMIDSDVKEVDNDGLVVKIEEN